MLKELFEKADKNTKEKLRKSQWGKWVFDRKNCTLTYDPERTGYEIDLEEIHTSAEMLDWVFQLWNKIWIQEDDPQGIADLIAAFDDLLYPQSNYCSFGKDKRVLNPKEIIEEKFKEVGL